MLQKRTIQLKVGFFKKQWFLLTLAVVLAVGMGFAPAFEALQQIRWLKWTVVSITMFLIVWPFSFGKLTETLLKPQAALLATVINSVVMPLAVWPFALLVGNEIGAGMVVAFAAPCTVVSAAVWTRRAGGDDRIAILVTLITNLICFLNAPFWIWLLTGSEQNSVDRFSGTATKLLMFVVLPIVVAQVVRLNLKSANWATSQKKQLGIVSQIGLLFIVFLGSIQSGMRIRDADSNFPVVELVAGVACLLLVHLLVLYFGKWIAGVLKMTHEEQVAVGFAGSQKTLMVGLSIAVSLQVTILPLLAFHSLQLVIDTLIADRMVNEQPPRREIANRL